MIRHDWVKFEYPLNYKVLCKHTSFYEARPRKHCNSSEPIRKVYVQGRANQKAENRGRVFRLTKRNTQERQQTRLSTISLLTLISKPKIHISATHTGQTGNWETSHQAEVEVKLEKYTHIHRAKQHRERHNITGESVITVISRGSKTLT